MAGSLFNAASKMYTKTGVASKMSPTPDILIGITLGLGFGALWKMEHWNQRSYHQELMNAKK